MELKKGKRRRGSGRGSVRRSVYEQAPGVDEAADRPARVEDTIPPGEDEKAPGPDRAAGGTVASKQGKATPIFVSHPGPPSKRAAVAVDVFGRVRETIECEDETAASHWDRRLWHPLA